MLLPEEDTATTLPDGTLQAKPPTPNERKQLAFDLIAAGGYRDSEIAALIGVDRTTLFRWKQNDPAFLETYRASRVVNVEKLVAEAERRAMNSSDKLLMFLLCNQAPERFKLVGKVEVNLHADLVEKLAAGRKRLGK